jgi:hypothetical protein
MKWSIELKFEPRGIWVDVHWDLKKGTDISSFDYLRLSFIPIGYWHIYICIIPMLPIHIFQSSFWDRKTAKR